MLQERPESLLQEGTSTLGISISPNQENQFLLYLQLLKRWNRRINLTSHTDDKAIIEWHFLDSLVGLRGFEAHKGLKLLDLGTGAGFPGFPLKITCPDIKLTLADSSHKKTAFLHHLSGVLKFKGVSILTERVEDLSKQPEHKASYDVVVARAFAKPVRTFETAVPFLATGGRLLMYLTSSGLRDLAPQEAWKVKRIDYVLPFSEAERSLLILVRSV